MSGPALWKMNRTCRLCLINGAKACIFENKTVLENIMTFCNLEVLKNDGLPSFICDECILKVEDITKFITQCRENEKILWSNLNLHNEHETDILLSNNQTETFGSDDITNFDSECDLEIPDKLHFIDDDEKKLMDSIQVSENGEEFLCYAGIKIIVHRVKSKKRAIATMNIIKKSRKKMTRRKKKNITPTLCPICGKFSKELGLHMKLHGDQKFTCDICSKTFKLKEQIKNHMVAHSDVRNFECTECFQKYKTKDSLRRHTLRLHNTTPILYPCNVCNKNFKRNSELKRHTRIHTGERNYQCSSCNEKFIHKSSLIRHMRLHTDDGEKKLTDDIKISENGEEFLYYARKKTIRRKKKNMKPTLCPICGKFTKELGRHLELHGDKKFTCDICSKTFKLKEQIKNHMMAHSDVRNFECTECFRKYKTKDTLVKHTFLMHNMTHILYPCNVCNKNFKRNSALKDHMRTHTGEKNFQCSYCNKKFAFRNSLTYHIRVHTGEKPYSCKYCDKCFSMSKSMKDHERLHTGEKPHECPVCDKGFEQLSNMKSHFKNNHKGVEFKRKPLLRS